MTTPKICEGYRASLCLCLLESLTWQSQALGSAKEERVIAVKEVDGGSGGQLESGLWGNWLTTCIPAYKLSEPFMGLEASALASSMLSSLPFSCPKSSSQQ